MVSYKIIFGCGKLFDCIRTIDGIIIMTYLFPKFIFLIYFNDIIHIKQPINQVESGKLQNTMQLSYFSLSNQNHDWNCSPNTIVCIFTVMIYSPQTQSKKIHWIESHWNEKNYQAKLRGDQQKNGSFGGLFAIIKEAGLLR